MQRCGVRPGGDPNRDFRDFQNFQNRNDARSGLAGRRGVMTLYIGKRRFPKCLELFLVSVRRLGATTFSADLRSVIIIRVKAAPGVENPFL